MRWACVLLLLAGCPRKAPEPTGHLTLEPEPVVPQRAVIPPGHWTDGQGLSVELPPGWIGQAGPPGGSLLLTVQHAASGVRVEIWSFQSSGSVGPRPRPLCEWTFQDKGDYRDVPALAPAVTGTCVPTDPALEVVQGWYGRVRDREIAVEVVYPPSRVVEGFLQAEPVLRGITAIP